MRLIVELYLHGVIPEAIIITCMSALLEDLDTDQSVELLCQTLQKIAQYVTDRYRQEKDENSSPDKKKKKYQKTY